jgi:hypothetical protein
MIVGRKALKEIRETGESGRNRAVWAIAVNALVTGSLVAGVVTSWIDGGPSAGDNLMEYRAHQCFDVPGPGSQPQLAQGFVAPVRKTSCSGPHEGEVVGRWNSGHTYAEYPGDDVIERRALGECTRQLTGYAMDPWRWPPSLQLAFVGLTHSAWMQGSRSDVVCYVRTAGADSVRQDSTRLTADQRAYLNTVGAYAVASAQRPRAKSAFQDFDGWRTYSASMADAALHERDALRSGQFPAAAAGPLAELEALDQRDAAHWRKAARAFDPDEIDQEAAAAGVDDGYQQATAALRRALGLPVDVPHSHAVSI